MIPEQNIRKILRQTDRQRHRDGDTERESTETETERVVEELIISTIPFLPSSPEQTIQNKTSAQYQNTMLTIKRERGRQTDRQTDRDRDR